MDIWSDVGKTKIFVISVSSIKFFTFLSPLKAPLIHSIGSKINNEKIYINIADICLVVSLTLLAISDHSSIEHPIYAEYFTFTKRNSNFVLEFVVHLDFAFAVR